MSFHGGDDLAPTAAELEAELLGNASHVGVALLDFLEEQADRARQLVPEDGLVDEPGGPRVAVQVA